MIEINNLNVLYNNSIRALDNVSIKIEQQKCIAIVGENGSGKSTLLSSLLGLVETQGEIKINGVMLSKETLIQIREVAGLVFQNPDHMIFLPTVRDNLAFGLINQKLDKIEIDKRIAEFAKLFKIEDLLDRMANHLSGGQKRMVGLASVVVMKPEILLLDEPSAFLDPKSRRIVINMLKELPQQIIFATHDLDMVLDLCDEIILLNNGKIVSSGNPCEILANQELLEANGVENHEISVDEAAILIDNPIDYATIDYNRKRRTGTPEIIYGSGKTKEQIAGIIKNMLEHDQIDILATRVDATKAAYLKKLYPNFNYDKEAKTFILKQSETIQNKGMIVVVCAGTSDIPIAREAVLTAEFLGNEVNLISDVGVAGIHRLFNKMDVIKRANVIIVVAGMEGALASVVGGLVDKPVIAVPTSIGYGANFNGLSALLSMLNSCASGVSVVNIDNGFGAGYMAHTINCLGGKR